MIRLLLLFTLSTTALADVPPGPEPGCRCATSSAPTSAGWALGGLAALTLRRRR